MYKLLLFLLLISFSGCSLYVAESDDTTYREMVDFGIDHLSRNLDEYHLLVRDDGQKLSVIHIDSNFVAPKESWVFNETIEVQDKIYDTYLDSNNRIILINRL